jgi:hypothetical protein
MQRLVRLVLAAAAVALVASPVLAQRGPRGGMMRMPGLMLLTQKSVQEDLKLSEDQVKKLSEAARKQFEAFGKLQEVDEADRPKKMEEIRKEGRKAVADILSKEQTKRLGEIRLQVERAAAFADPAVAKQLNFNDDQKKQLKAIQEEANKARTQILEDAGGDFQTAGPKIREAMQKANAKMMKVLNEDQQAKWKEMIGKPFKGQIRFGPPRRPRNDN